MAGSSDTMSGPAQRWKLRSACARHKQPVDLVREYQDWISSAFERVIADGYACQQFVGAFAGLLQGAKPESG
jgi:hypothetical protein